MWIRVLVGKFKKKRFFRSKLQKNFDELKSLETKMVVLGVHVSLCFYSIIFGFSWRSGNVLERFQMLLKETTMTNKLGNQSVVYILNSCYSQQVREYSIMEIARIPPSHSHWPTLVI